MNYARYGRVKGRRSFVHALLMRLYVVRLEDRETLITVAIAVARVCSELGIIFRRHQYAARSPVSKARVSVVDCTWTDGIP